MNKLIRIETTGPGLGKVWVDGVELQGVSHLHLHIVAGKVNTLIVGLLAEKVEVSGPARIIEEPVQDG